MLIMYCVLRAQILHPGLWNATWKNTEFSLINVKLSHSDQAELKCRNCISEMIRFNLCSLSTPHLMAMLSGCSQSCSWAYEDTRALGTSVCYLVLLFFCLSPYFFLRPLTGLIWPMILKQVYLIQIASDLVKHCSSHLLLKLVILLCRSLLKKLSGEERKGFVVRAKHLDQEKPADSRHCLPQ